MRESKDPTAVGWTVRAFLTIGIGLTLYFGDGVLLDIGKLANVVTVLAAVLAVWTLFDTRLLTWVVDRIVSIARQLRARSELPNSPAPQQQPAAPAPAITAMPSAAPDPQPPAPVWVTAVIGGLLAVAFYAGCQLFAPPTRPPAVKPDPVAIPSAPALQPASPVPEAQALPIPPATIETSKGDNCWSIARRCTGTGARFTELGPPLNNIDIDDPLCPLGPGQVLKLPTSWNADCSR